MWHASLWVSLFPVQGTPGRTGNTDHVGDSDDDDGDGWVMWNGAHEIQVPTPTSANFASIGFYIAVTPCRRRPHLRLRWISQACFASSIRRVPTGKRFYSLYKYLMRITVGKKIDWVMSYLSVPSFVTA